MKIMNRKIYIKKWKIYWGGK